MNTPGGGLALDLAGLDIEPLEISVTTDSASLEALGTGHAMPELAASCGCPASCCISCCCCCCG